uniref:Uncharacterized protein MANES_04G151600 n=2 Tax=Rhizophora mucronata TaxID=61149 RepID=A0A2P2ILX3_RHIMU
MIAEASRRGYVGEEELQWDSYKSLSEKLEHEWLDSVELRKRMRRPKGSKRAPKSAEQRRRIAEAIAAKWADPVYRVRVCSSIAKYHGTPVGAERKLRQKPSNSKQFSRQDGPEEKISARKNSSASDTTSHIPHLRLRRSKTPSYKDPLASSKLEMIKNIRAQRAVTETKKTEAIARARLLIAEAEKAARALEVAATRSPLVRASLLETRRLIAEAIQSIESVDPGNFISNENYGTLSPASGHMIEENEMGKDMGNGVFGETWLREVNGSQVLGSGKDEDLNFGSLTFPAALNNQKELLPTSSRDYGLSSFNLESLLQQSNSEKQLGKLKSNGGFNSASTSPPNGSRIHLVKEEKPFKPLTKIKKWVRGRLVEVTERD